VGMVSAKPWPRIHTMNTNQKIGLIFAHVVSIQPASVLA